MAGAPLLGAALIALSRIEDYRHDVWDVSAGSALGMGIAWLTYRRFYPGLRTRGCSEPWPKRGDVGRKEGKIRMDEEAALGEVDEEDFSLGSDGEEEESVPLQHIDGGPHRS